MGKRYRMLDWLGTILILGVMLICSVSVTHFEKFIGYAPFVSFVILAIFFFNHVNIIEKFRERDAELFLIIVGMAISILNIYLVKSGVGIAVVLLNLFLILYLSDKVIIDNKIIYLLSGVSAILLLSWIGKEARGFNTNLASMLIFSLAAVAIAGGMKLMEHKGYKLVGKVAGASIWLLVVLPLVIVLRARGVVLGIIAVLIFGFLLPEKIWKVSWFYKIGIAVLFIASIALPVIYVAMKESGVEISFSLMGKRFFSGRDIVWEQFLTAFSKEPWTGIGSNLTEKIVDALYTEAHNGFLNVLTVYGVVTFGIFIVLLYKKIVKAIEMAASSLSGRVALGTILAMFVISFFENYVFISPYCLLLMILFGVINQKDKVIEQ